MNQWQRRKILVPGESFEPSKIGSSKARNSLTTRLDNRFAESTPYSIQSNPPSDSVLPISTCTLPERLTMVRHAIEFTLSPRCASVAVLAVNGGCGSNVSLQGGNRQRHP